MKLFQTKEKLQQLHNDIFVFFFPQWFIFYLVYVNFSTVHKGIVHYYKVYTFHRYHV